MDVSRVNQPVYNPALERTTVARKSVPEPAETSTNSASERAEAKASPAADRNEAPKTADKSPSAGVKTDSKTGHAAKNHKGSAEKPSEVKSFVYGSLGLEHPEEQEKPHDGFYSAGRWLAAAVTVGTLISVLA